MVQIAAWIIMNFKILLLKCYSHLQPCTTFLVKLYT